jgi:hypothetical protein
MYQDDKIFDIAVEINKGLEPLTFSIIPHSGNVTDDHILDFKVMRDKETLAVLRKDADQCWKQLEGHMEQDDVDAIGAAIDSHYA